MKPDFFLTNLTKFFSKTGFLSVILCNSHDYVLAESVKFGKRLEISVESTTLTWPLARLMKSGVNNNNKLRAKYRPKTWIGLNDDVNSWHWSFQNKCPHTQDGIRISQMIMEETKIVQCFIQMDTGMMKTTILNVSLFVKVVRLIYFA